MSADYVRRAHRNGLDVIPFTLDTAADVRAARAAKVDELITDDPLMAAGAMGLKPARAFDASVFIDGRRLITVVHLLGPRGVSGPADLPRRAAHAGGDHRAGARSRSTAS